VAKGATRAWPDLSLDDEWRGYAALHGVEAEVEFESFRDYHMAKGNKFADWFAAWRTWCRNSEKYKNEKRPTIGFTAPPRLSMQMQQAIRDNEEVAQELRAMTPQQIAVAKRRLAEIIGSIK
jgi:hypothetical protein